MLWIKVHISGQRPSVYLARNSELFRKKKLSVSAGTDLINNCRLKSTAGPWGEGLAIFIRHPVLVMFTYTIMERNPDTLKTKSYKIPQNSVKFLKILQNPQNLPYSTNFGTCLPNIKNSNILVATADLQRALILQTNMQTSRTTFEALEFPTSVTDLLSRIRLFQHG